MTYEQLQQILSESTRSDWLFNDERGVLAYKGDLNLRIVRNSIDHDSDRFEGEDWATKHSDPVAYRVTYEVFYGSTFIEEHLLVEVDGFRATLPLPKIGTNKVTQKHFKFAEIVDDTETLSEYMDRAGLEVE